MGKVNELLKGSEADTRGRLERCVSKISDFGTISQAGDELRSPVKSTGGRPMLTADIIKAAKLVGIDPETKIG